jgi:chromate transport protein ChrA
MEAMIYPAIKILLIAIAIMAAVAYFAHKAGEKKLFKRVIKLILEAAIVIIGMLVIVQAGKNLQKTTEDALKDFGNKHHSISSSSKDKRK